MRSPDDSRFSAWTFVAPAVLVAAIFVVANVVRGGTEERAPTVSAGARPAAEQPAARTARAGAPAVGRRRTYTVRPGDTLGAIAQRTGTTAARLQQLNPRLDPGALQPGARIRVS